MKHFPFLSYFQQLPMYTADESILFWSKEVIHFEVLHLCGSFCGKNAVFRNDGFSLAQLFVVKVIWSRLWTQTSPSKPHHCFCLLQLQQYQYYSAGLLSTYDPFYEQQRHLLGPKKKKFKEEKKLKGEHIDLPSIFTLFSFRVVCSLLVHLDFEHMHTVENFFIWKTLVFPI